MIVFICGESYFVSWKMINCCLFFPLGNPLLEESKGEIVWYIYIHNYTYTYFGLVSFSKSTLLFIHAFPLIFKCTKRRYMSLLHSFFINTGTLFCFCRSVWFLTADHVFFFSRFDLQFPLFPGSRGSQVGYSSWANCGKGTQGNPAPAGFKVGWSLIISCWMTLQ